MLTIVNMQDFIYRVEDYIKLRLANPFQPYFALRGNA
jgi:hypothetical protein